MTRPASLRPQKAFIGKNKKAGSKPLEIDWDRIDDSYNHRANDQLNRLELKTLRQDLIDAEARGAYSKVRKIRRAISHLLEANLAISATWCNTCLNYLHRCKCPRVVREGLHPSTVRAIARKEVRDLDRLEKVRLQLKAKIQNT